MLSFGSIFPLIQATVYNSIFHPEGSLSGIKKHADPLADILSNSISNAPTAHSVGLLVIISLMICFFLFTKGENKIDRHTAIVSGTFLTLGIIMMLSASSLFPWGLVGRFRLFRIIQFPWRLNAYATLFIPAACSAVICRFRSRTKLIIAISTCILSIVLTWSALIVLHDTEEERIIDETIEYMHYVYPDYSPKVARDNWRVNEQKMDDFYLDGTLIDPETNTSANGSSLHFVIKKAKAGQQLDIPVYWFTTLNATVNGKRVESRMSDRGTVLLTIPSDGPASIEIKHTYNKSTYCAWIFSAAFLIVLLIQKSKDSHENKVN